MTETEAKNGASAEAKEETKEVAAPATPAQIMRQLEHYFGDYNLPRDKFLRETVENATDGWVPMETMLKFKRLASIESDGDKIMEAVKAQKSALIEAHESEAKIRRNPSKPVPEWNDDRKKALQKQTVYVKGFDKENTKLDDLLEFFDAFDGVINVQMRNFTNKKTEEKGFKGSTFVTFDTLENATKFVELETLKKGEAELVKKWQLDYFADKHKEVEEKRKADKEAKEKLKKAKEEAQKEGEEKMDSEEKKEEDEANNLPKGSVLAMKGFSEEDTSREDIVAVFESEFGVNRQESIAYIYFQRGETEAKIRFKAENYAVDLEKRMKEKFPEGKLEVKGAKEVTFALLEGEEETAFLDKCLEDMKNRGKGKNARSGHKRRGGFRGGPGGKRGRR